MAIYIYTYISGSLLVRKSEISTQSAYRPDFEIGIPASWTNCGGGDRI